MCDTSTMEEHSYCDQSETEEDIQLRQLLEYLDHNNRTAEERPSSERLELNEVYDAIQSVDPTFGTIQSVDPAAFGPITLEQDLDPFVLITKQPASKAHRFRYPCESRSTGSIPGVCSTPENRTYPTIRICNYIGEVGIVVSCVTKDEPYRPHPHHLIGNGVSSSKKGVYAIRTDITEQSNEHVFTNLGIQCLKKADRVRSLRMRARLRIDPFDTGFDHVNNLHNIDMSAVRLCFQVLIPNETGQLRRLLAPVVSNVIYDKKAIGDLVIVMSSHCSGSAKGGTQVILLCKPLTKEVSVVFFLEENKEIVWEAPAAVQTIHKHVAIVFETPAFREPHITEPVTVHFQIRKTNSEGWLEEDSFSNSLPFEYTPDYPPVIEYKRKKISSLLSCYNDDNINLRRNCP